MRNIKLTIEYDGKDFNGWQKQPDKLNIQGSIESAIKQITGEDVLKKILISNVVTKSANRKVPNSN